MTRPLWFFLAAALGVAGCKANSTVGNSVLDVGMMRVQDKADLLRSADEIDLTRRSEALEKATTDQLVVVTVPTLGGQEIAPFSTAFANRLGLGQQDKDNGVLLVVAPNERKVRISVGYGLEGLLTDRRAAQIIQHMLPHFRQGDYSEAIRLGVAEIDSVLRSDMARPQPKFEEPRKAA